MAMRLLWRARDRERPSVPMQVSEAPVPDVAKPALHVQVAAPALLLLLTGHAVHEVAPGVAM
jgi:hypothetical protein